MVGVRVPEHDAADPAELRTRARNRSHHRARARVEQGHAALVLQQVHVAAARLALDHPHALGHELGLGHRQARGQARLGVKRPGQPLVGCGPLRRQHADLARQRDRVGEGVVGLDLAVAHGQ